MDSEKNIHTGSHAMDQVLERVDGFKSTMIIISACQLELFDHVHRHQPDCTASRLAAQNGWDADCTERLLNGLVAMELIRKDATSQPDHRYSLTETGELLRKDKPYTLFPYVTNLERFMHAFKTLPEEVRTGSKKGAAFPTQVVVHKQEAEGDQGSSAAAQAPGHGHGHKKMPILDRYNMYEGMARVHIRTLATAFDLSGFKKAVDLGGGSGTLAFELARVYKNMNVTLFEVPPVIQLVKEHFEPKEEKLGVNLVEGDFFENDIPDGDLYILSKIVHDWSSEQTTTLLKKVASKLQSGGGIILMEKCLNDAKDGPVSGHVWDLLVMSHCAGRLRSGNEYRQLLASVGFTDIRIAKTQPECSYDVIYGKKA